MKFNELINETPHIFLLKKNGEDIEYDFKREFGPEWVKDVIGFYKDKKISNATGKTTKNWNLDDNDLKKLSKELENNPLFRIAFKIDYNSLDLKTQNELKKYLPKSLFL